MEASKPEQEGLLTGYPQSTAVQPQPQSFHPNASNIHTHYYSTAPSQPGYGTSASNVYYGQPHMPYLDYTVGAPAGFRPLGLFPKALKTKDDPRGWVRTFGGCQFFILAAVVMFLALGFVYHWASAYCHQMYTSGDFYLIYVYFHSNREYRDGLTTIVSVFMAFYALIFVMIAVLVLILLVRTCSSTDFVTQDPHMPFTQRFQTCSTKMAYGKTAPILLGVMNGLSWLCLGFWPGVVLPAIRNEYVCDSGGFELGFFVYLGVPFFSLIALLVEFRLASYLKKMTGQNQFSWH